MENDKITDSSPIDESERIINTARGKKITIRLIGGLAIRFHCHGPHSKHLRHYNDIDLFGLQKDFKKISSVLTHLGYSPNVRFNSIYGANRLQFINKENLKTIDVFLDKFMMEHTLDFKKRLFLDDFTIPIVDLLLSKLQIPTLEKKDMVDIMAILEDHAIGKEDKKEIINVDYIAELCSGDWGLNKTIANNLSNISDFVNQGSIEFLHKKDVLEKIVTIEENLKKKKKKLRWKIRNLIGEKMKWYSDVELGEGEQLYE